MADEEKIGRPWNDDELDAIVADYFSMLRAELSRQPYVKSRHSAALMGQLGRSHRSVEFKHQNISAVVDELGMSSIPGYMPSTNYQNAIIGAVERYLTQHADALESVRISPIAPTIPSVVFVDPPTLAAVKGPMPNALQHLVRKFDPVERYRRNRSLG